MPGVQAWAATGGGLRDSIRVGVGYGVVVIATLVAFSYAGFDLSNLAILAGAFSVGIGFGLQSIVNNFVSGLILLAERPIKIGDLVVVGGEEAECCCDRLRRYRDPANSAHSDGTDSYAIPGRAGSSSARSKTPGQLD